MRKTDQTTRSSSVISIRDAFSALKVLSDQRFINGTDNWRMETGNDSLASFDGSLALAIQKQPPSKFGHADTPSLWTATHFYVALPSLSYAIRKYGQEDEQTSTIVLRKDDLKKYFIAFPYILKYFREYQQFERTYGVPSIELWKAYSLIH